jgi:hypothetical protein
VQEKINGEFLPSQLPSGQIEAVPVKSVDRHIEVFQIVIKINFWTVVGDPLVEYDVNIHVRVPVRFALD